MTFNGLTMNYPPHCLETSSEFFLYSNLITKKEVPVGVDATDFEGVNAICRNIGRLSLQVESKKKKKLGSSDFSS